MGIFNASIFNNAIFNTGEVVAVATTPISGGWDGKRKKRKPAIKTRKWSDPQPEMRGPIVIIPAVDPENEDVSIEAEDDEILMILLARVLH